MLHNFNSNQNIQGENVKPVALFVSLTEKVGFKVTNFSGLTFHYDNSQDLSHFLVVRATTVFQILS